MNITTSTTSLLPELKLEFRGTAREYFRIWIVNLCLTLLSCGIFSAWAKVRKKRYFYSHTTLDGTPFQYLGQPLPILKGRIIAVVLFLIYYASSNFFTSTMPFVLAAGFVLAPWVVMRSAAFNARYSAFRNMPFQFYGNYWNAFKTLYAWGLVPLLIAGSAFSWWGNPAFAGAAFGLFGLAFPFWLRQLKHYLISHSAYGCEFGDFSATGGQFYKIYFKAGLIMVATAALVGVLAGVLFAAASNTTFSMVFAFLTMTILYAGYVLSYSYAQAHTSNLAWNQTTLGTLEFQSTLTAMGLAKLYTTNALAIIATLGLLTPWAVIRTLKYRADHMQVCLEGNLADFTAAGATTVQAAGAEVGELFDLDLSL